MKKMFAVILVLILAAMSCCAAVAEEMETKENPMMMGGWQINTEDIAIALTEEEQEIFSKAQAEDYAAVAVLATQVVAGTNYAFLARNENGWAVVTVYRNLQGEASLLSIQPIDLADVKIAEDEMPADLVGGWAIREVSSNAAVLTEEAHAAFAAAAQDRALAPIALLGTQLVAGMNYKLLALENGALYVVTVYQPLTGDAEITEIAPMDLLAYVNR